MPKPHIRAVITGAGTGSSGNLIRALRKLSPAPYIVGVNDDRFVLKLSLADRNYLCPKSDSAAFVDAMLDVIGRERANVVMPTDDTAVKALSRGRKRFSINLLLPRRSTVDLCQDKYALNVFLRRLSIPAPVTYEVKALRDLDKIFARFSGSGLLWCRLRHGSRSVAASPVATIEQARSWITQWRDLRKVSVSDFTVAEYLPGRHYVVHSVWCSGNLLCVKSVEVLAYFAAGNNPSGVFSLSCLAKTVLAPTAVKVALSAVRALERRPSGAFFIELKETSDGVPSITEINAGRFPSGVTALMAEGADNMVNVFAAAATGEPIRFPESHETTSELYLIRDIDAVPAVVSAEDLLGDTRRLGVESERK
jgi:hypothetical protein